MKKVMIALVLGVFLVGVVSAIACSEADYDKDGDVDAMDILKFNQCNPSSEQYNPNATWDCSFFDFNNDGVVNDADGDLMSEWSFQSCPTCTDSDGGKDYYERGYIDLTSGENKMSYIEICTWSSGDLTNGEEGDSVAESWCEDGEKITETYKCPNRCKEGACVEEVITECIDSDGGKDYYGKGKITFGNEYAFDSCLKDMSPEFGETERTLIEHYCAGDEESYGQFHSEHYQCPDGCQDGACVSEDETDEVELEVGIIDKEPPKSNEKDIYGETEPNPNPDYIEKECDNGCSSNGKCFSYGYRKAIDGSLRYCFESGEWLSQMEEGSSCQNNFECDSNVCVDNECVSAGLLRRILNWFKRLFS